MIGDPGRTVLSHGDLEATVLPRFGMLVASLKWRGVELLRRVENLEDAARKGSTAGIPLLYPWANRLDGLSYRAVGREVVLDRQSPLLHFDGNGLPIHGVPWSQLAWRLVEAQTDSVTARLEWGGELLSVFPFAHQVEMQIALDGALSIAVTVIAKDDPVPLSFGFHPYFGLSGIERHDWHLQLPAMEKLTLDARGIPTGEREDFASYDAPLGDTAYDDGFALRNTPATLSLSGGGRSVALEIDKGYTFAQVYAPKDQDLVALEPMTAPANALVSGDGLNVVRPGETFAATFRITAS